MQRLRKAQDKVVQLTLVLEKMNIKTIKLLIVVCLFGSAGMLAWLYQTPLIDKLSTIIPSLQYLYLTEDEVLIKKYSNEEPIMLSWEALIPPTEREIIQQFQAPTAVNIAEQILLSLNASTNEAYRDAMFSTNVVKEQLGKLSTISGFIVPLELASQQQLSSFFLVPYFGACIHYPPPPPNQMIFVRVNGNMKVPDINAAYSVTGILKQGLYEDVVGTSAYQFDLVSIKPFSGQPDDFRQHDTPTL
jgi:hypothetical protein